MFEISGKLNEEGEMGIKLGFRVGFAVGGGWGCSALAAMMVVGFDGGGFGGLGEN